VSGNDSAERVAEIIDCADTVVFLKTYRNRDRLLKIIEEKGLTAAAHMYRNAVWTVKALCMMWKNWPVIPNIFH